MLYDLGLIIGRFQMFHNGHKMMIEHALELCNRVVVFIGSSQKSNTKENPFSYYVRSDMIEFAFPVEVKTGKILIRPLPDIGVGNNTMWGDYVLGVFEEEFDKKPDLYITGCEKERPSWFTNEMAPNMDELRISRSNLPVTASYCRQLMLDDDKETWKANVPYQIYKKYDFYKKILDDIKKKGE